MGGGGSTLIARISFAAAQPGLLKPSSVVIESLILLLG